MPYVERFFLFGQVGGVADVRLCVQPKFHSFLMVVREEELNPIIVIAHVLILGCVDGFLFAIDDHGTGLGCGQGHIFIRHRSVIVQGDSVCVAVGTHYAPVLKLDVEGAVDVARHGKGAGFEELGEVVAAGSMNEVFVVGIGVIYFPIKPITVPRFSFGQVDGVAIHVQVFVQFKLHPSFTVVGEVEVEIVFAIALFQVFGHADGRVHPVDGQCAFGFGLWCSAAVVIVAVF